MKKPLLSIIALVLLLTIITVAKAQNVNIPDANFKAYLVGNAAINTNGDGEIQLAEAAAFTGWVDVYNKDIADLTGIEAFTNITRLDCDQNKLTTLDLSKNTALTFIQCSVNQLTSLNLKNGNNHLFHRVFATENPYLTCIQVDNVANANSYNTAERWWHKDATASYSTNCSSFVLTPNANGVVFVKKGSTGNGNSWENATPELADALDAAKNNTAITQIWVAGGTYTPKYTPEDGQNFKDSTALALENQATRSHRDRAFLLVNNVKLYGGFAGTETTLAQRNLGLTANKTILSADFSDNDGLSPTNNNENAYHVVVSNGAVGTAEINGFTISGGNGGNATAFKVKGLDTYRNYGAGINIQSSSPTLTNVTITGNNANYGGAICNSNSASPILTNIAITGNSTATWGTMANFASSPTLTNVTIAGNSAGSGGAMYNLDSSPIIKNSIIYGNNTGIVTTNIQISSTPQFSYSLVQGNPIGTNMVAFSGNANQVFVNPLSPGLNMGGNYTPKTGSPVINVGNNTLYTTAGGNLTTDKDLYGNKRLDFIHIDLGAYESITNYTPTANILYVDIAVSGGNKSGDSWENAIPQLADALVWANENKTNYTNATPLNIYVAKGTYKPLYSPQDVQNYGSVQNNRDKAFLIFNNLKLYGGFDPANNITDLTRTRQLPLSGGIGEGTILSGDLDNNDTYDADGNITNSTNANNAYHVVVAANPNGSASINLDGFIITDGNANDGNSISVSGMAVLRNHGGGINYTVNVTAAITVTNCIIKNNVASLYGGAGISIYSTASASATVVVNSSHIHNNGAGSFGGAIACIYSGGTYITVNSSHINNNAGGGAIFAYAAYTVQVSVNNSIVNNNSTGILTSTTNWATLSVNNSTFVGNGGLAYLDGSSKTFNATNSIVYGNGGGISTSTYGNPLSKNIRYSLIQDESSPDNGNLDGTAASYTLNNIFTNAANGNFSLKHSSPVVNKGSNQLYVEAGGNIATGKDLAGNPRVFDGTIDMGAYEHQVTQCPSGDYVFNTQAQLNAFKVLYSECTNITLGKVLIGYPPGNDALSDITDLSALANVKILTDSLMIRNNPNLISLNGFNTLTSIGASLWVGNNEQLEEINGFTALTSTGKFFTIRDNARLTKINGFTALSSVGEHFFIGNNDKLTKIDGFNTLTSVTHHLYIYHNDELEKINGFAALANVGKYLVIRENAKLESINGFGALTNTGEHLSIYTNAKLKTINGFNNLSIVGTNTNHYLQFMDNAELTEISGFSLLTSVKGYFWIRNTPALATLSAFAALTNVREFEISNTALTNLNNFSNLTTVGNQKLAIQSNPQLTNISGLANIGPATIGGSSGLVITNNTALSVCNLPNFCTYLSGSGARNISENKTTCLNVAAVIVACNPVLPVTLITFTAQANGNHAKLQWQTANEVNNKGFEIWRKVEGVEGGRQEGSRFIKIGEVSSQIPSALQPSVFYSFIDKTPLNGTNYYKLLQVDNDGISTDLGVRSLLFSLSASTLNLYPNPTSNEVTISFENGKYHTLTITDVSGKILQEIPIKPTENSIQVSLGKYAMGIYLMRLIGKDGSETVKVLRN